MLKESESGKSVSSLLLAAAELILSAAQYSLRIFFIFIKRDLLPALEG
jgi:hypothetical protein